MDRNDFDVQQPQPDTLAVSGSLNFDTAAGVLAQAGARLAQGSVRVLDLSGVKSADSAGLACVLALMAEAHGRGAQLAVRNMPEGLALLARVSDIDGVLEAS